MQDTKPQYKLSPEEISFLEEKKQTLTMHLILFPFGVLIAIGCYFLYLSQTFDIVFLSAITVGLYSIVFGRDLLRRIRISKDIAGGVKTTFTAIVEDFKEAAHNTKSGRYVGSDYFLYLDGVKYEVKEKYFYRFRKGNTVKVYVTPNSKFAFDFEKEAVG